MNTDNTDREGIGFWVPISGSPDLTLCSFVSFVVKECPNPRLSAFIRGKILLFRSPDHPITRDHPIFLAGFSPCLCVSVVDFVLHP
jgi:hypothetical protein